MSRISIAAMFAAALSLSAVPSVGLIPAVAQETTTSSSGFTSDLSIPTIDAVDSSMDEAALRDVLGGNVQGHAADLAGLNATSITIPEITLTMHVSTSGATTTSSAIYRDVTLTNVRNGVAENAVVGSTESTSPEGTLRFGKLEAHGFNIAGILGLYGMVESTGGGQMQALYSDFTFDGGTFTSPQANCTFGKVTTGQFNARPLKVSFKQLMEAGQQLDAAEDDPPPAAMKTVVTFLTDLFQAMKSEPLKLEGLSCSGTDASDNPFEFTVGGITMDGYAPGIYPALNVTGLKIASGPQDAVTLDSFTVKPIDLSGPIAALEAQIDNLTPEWFEENYRKLIPAFAGAAFSGLHVDIEDPDNQGERIKADVAGFDLSLSDYVNGVPSKVSTESTGINVPLPDNPSDPQLAMFKAMGIDRVNVSYKLAGAWDQANQAIDIDEISIAGVDLGKAVLSGVIGNATDKLFDSDPDVVQMAALGTTFKSVTLHLTDDGLGDLVVPLTGAPAGTDPAAFRAQMAAGLEGATIAMLGSSDATRLLASAIGDFVGGKAKELEITVTAKDPGGLPIPVLMQKLDGVEDPTMLAPILAELVDITGSAS